MVSLGSGKRKKKDVFLFCLSFAENIWKPVLDDSKRVPVPENDDIGSTSWPEMGMYSSSDPTVLAQHCRQMADSGIGVAIVSWYGPLRADQKEDLFAGFQDRTVPLLLEAAANAGIRVAFHHEVLQNNFIFSVLFLANDSSKPYPGRTADTVLSDLEYIHSKYASHPGCYLHDGPRGKLVSALEQDVELFLNFYLKASCLHLRFLFG